MGAKDPDVVLKELKASAEQAGGKLFAVLDAARDPRIHPRVAQEAVKKSCLYKGDIPLVLASAAPWLVDLGASGDLLPWLVKEAWGDSWGTFVVSAKELKDLRDHFRKLLLVEREGGQKLYFRFYDPRVLRQFLPTCNEAELGALFGPVAAYVVEGKDPATLVRYTRQGAALGEQTVPIAPPPQPPPAKAAAAGLRGRFGG